MNATRENRSTTHLASLLPLLALCIVAAAPLMVVVADLQPPLVGLKS